MVNQLKSEAMKSIIYIGLLLLTLTSCQEDKRKLHLSEHQRNLCNRDCGYQDGDTILHFGYVACYKPNDACVG